jgi:uncharacterized repeat protein (TIGR01451 family)
MKTLKGLSSCLSCFVLYTGMLATPAWGALTANTQILNQAQLYYSDGITTRSGTASATITVVIRTPSVIEFLNYAPLLPGVELVNVSTTACRKGSTSTEPFVNMPIPVPVGATIPVDLSRPLPLTTASQLHQGEPIFIRLTDKDQNLDTTLTETVVVTVSNPANGDVEIIRLTETGPSTGVFTGYLATSGTPATSYNGTMSVKEGNILTARYLDLQDSSDRSERALMIDPFGIVFDSSSGLPVNGATITMINTTTGLPATVFGDDGISRFPAVIISGGSSSDSSGRVYSSVQPGDYRYPFVLPGSYLLRITPPSGYGSPSTVATATIKALPGGPFTIVTGSRGEAFVINSGPAMRIDVPIDPISTLWLQKSAGKESAGQGDFIPYQLTLTNGSTLIPVTGTLVTDILPIGFRLRAGSVRVNAVPADNPFVSADGRTLTFHIGTLGKGSVATVAYVAEVTAGARLGAAVNSAVAGSAGGTRSNIAHATVTIRDDFLRTRSTLMGRISTAACSDETGEGTRGVEGVRVYLEDGAFVISDKRGLFHFEGVTAGLHVVQLDIDSLPDGYEPYACTENSRFAGRAFSQFVETQGGTLWRTDFHIRPRTGPESETSAAELQTMAAPAGQQAATEAAAVLAAPGETPVASAPEIPAATVKDRDGILSPGENDILINRINGIRVRLDSKLTPRLLVDNIEIPADRIGFTMKDEKAGTTIYSYIGVDLGQPGDHVVEFQGMDQFGNTRSNQTISVKRSGEIVSIRLKSAEGNVADGKTPVKLRLELYDADGTRIPAGAELEIREGTLKPLKQKDLFSVTSAAGSFEQVVMTSEGDVLFQPVNSSGLYRVVLGYNSATVEAETYVQPKLRDWILVGLAEGTVGYNTASGNMESLQGTPMSEDLYQDGRIALFAKGQIQGKWLLTMAYDSARTKGNSSDGLFQTINPDTYYTLYGDASRQQYDAASAKKLYIRIEREQFYAMFGDYDTGLTVTELSRYSRRMTGLKTEFQSRNFELSAFASETEQAYTRDEIPGDGTSGIYRLSRKKIIPNSEKIAIEVRDRFRSEILVSSRALNRFTDYSIDYDTGAVIFKEPIHGRDQQFNPIMIIAEYETVAEGGQNYTYGGRAGVKLLDQRLKIGGSYIHEGQGDRSSNLFGVDTSLKLGQSTKIRAEFATSDFAAGSASRNGNAYLAEVTHTTKKFDARGYIREQEAGFGLGQQPGSEAGTRKFGVEGAYRANDRFSTNATLYRQYNLLNNATRDVAEGKLNYTAKSYGASVGVLRADDHLADGSNRRSNQLTMGGKVLTLYDRLTMTLDHAQSIGSSSNSDFPNRTALGGEFMVTRSLTLLAAQELTWGTGATTQNSRLGIRSTPWKGAAMTSSVERQFNENEERVFANVGLKQTWQISNAWRIDGGLDRSQTLARATHYRFNTNVPPASGGSENYTAVSSGATYQVKHLTWDNRLEFRLADSENKWGLMSGLVNEVDSRWAWSGRAQVFQTFTPGGIDTTKANLRYGLVFRPPETRWIVLNRLDYLIDTQSGSAGANIASWRLINNMIANYRPRKELQVSLQYGAKYVRDTIGDRNYSGFIDHIGFETRYDITKTWDIGMRGSLLHSWHSGQYDYSCGNSVGYNIFENAWVSVGYNIWGFEDKDFASAAYTAQGPYVRFRIKFDQQTVKDAASWLNRQ